MHEKSTLTSSPECFFIAIILLRSAKWFERSKKLYRYFNPNPLKKETGDCTVRAICAATDRKWDDVFYDLAMKAMEICEMPSSNNAWGEYLQDLGFSYSVIPDSCPFCYTIDDFCREHKDGIYIVGTGTHAVCVKFGDVYDTWDSRSKKPLFYFSRGLYKNP